LAAASPNTVQVRAAPIVVPATGVTQLPWVTADSTRSTQYVIEIPWKAGADSVVVDTANSNFGFIARRTVALAVKGDHGRAIRVVADLPRPVLADSAGIVYGTLWLRWFDHGRPLPNEAGVAQVAEQSRVPREARAQKRDRHDFQPVMMEGFSQSRFLCVRLGRAEAVRRAGPTALRPQTVLRGYPTPAPAVLDDRSC